MVLYVTPTTQIIINALKVDLMTIQPTNGYNLSMKKYFNVKKDINGKDLNSSDYDSFYIEGLPDKADYGSDFIDYTWDVGILFYIAIPPDTTKAGLLSQKIELLKQDIDKLFMGDMSVKQLESVSSVKILERYPPTDDGETTATNLYMIIEINYIV